MSNIITRSILFAILMVSQVVQASEFGMQPSIAVSEEFTDNVFESRSNRLSDFITRVLPGLVINYKAPALKGDIGYVFDYRHYARNRRDDEITHALSVKAKLTAVENLLFLDFSDEYQRVSLDATRDTTRESLFVNQSDRNVIAASPYLMFLPTERIKVKAGYRFVDTRYFKSSAIDKTDHIGLLDLAFELTTRLSLTAGYTFTREIADVENFSQHQALGGFRYEYADKSFAFAQAGNAWTRYGSGQRLNNLVWNAGITHVFDTVTGTAVTGVRYNEDPLSDVIKESFVSGTLEKRFETGSLSFSPGYSEYVQTKSDSLQTKKYGATMRGQYDFTSDLKGSLAFTTEKYEMPQSYTLRFLVDSSLSYLLAEQLTLSLFYVYTDYYSPDIVADNRHINRAMVEIKKTF